MRQFATIPVILAMAAFLVVLPQVASAAPSSSSSTESSSTSIGEWWNNFWSAWDLWWYRLLHGGRNPPGYLGTTSSSSSVSMSRTSTLILSSTLSRVSATPSFVSVSVSSSAVSKPSSVSSSSSAASKTSSILSLASSASSASARVSSSVFAPSTSSSSSAAPAATGVTTCSYQPASFFPLSCSAAAAGETDTCCTTTPGGHLLSTQFWDTGSMSTGPNNSWTLHGLWPDNCDGTYEQYCDTSRELTNITAVLAQAGQTELLKVMDTYWKDGSGDDETFWEHEYNKHGTCISGFEPRCFKNYQPQIDAVYYFKRAVQVYQTLPSYDWLAAAGIVPSLDKTYTLAEITQVLETQHGGGVNVQCTSANELDELWYHYVSQGSAVDGNMVPAPLVGSASSCPATGIKYLPKYTTILSTPLPNRNTTTSGKGYIYAAQNGTVPASTCVISAGSWYKGGTCATFTLGFVTGGAYTITSSKGPCAVDSNGLFTCASTVATPGEFLISSTDGSLTLGGSSVFSADKVPSGTDKVDIYKGAGKALPLTLQFKTL
ncbi:Ribonuclease, T2 family [Phaffia rhodozyma]|uniref:Ribonuclease T2-like n=1 Tax=Phaffia rhodozyma TaxID=264483 RepID=A0A0F7STE6_PHARH|nr:Ribonuclease, T2 family [Phaffia rhodozyma]